MTRPVTQFMGQNETVKFTFVADSQAYFFDHYSAPSGCQVAVDYVIRCGATISDLIPPTSARFHQYSESDRIIIRLAAGMNDIFWSTF